MQDIKQPVALTSIAASGELTLAMTYFTVRVSGRPADAEQGGQQGTQSHFLNCALAPSPRPDHSGTCEQNRASAPASSANSV